IYKILQPDLIDLANEGAFLLMCKQVLPTGLLGLMLAGMLFATASSVNTTLNMMSAVFTNDLYTRLVKDVSDTKLMQVARISTLIFGLVTILVALMVPAAGGIVEVVISVGAITGAPLFAPTIWALFSERQTAKSILLTTLISLSINLCFKFISPQFGISLDRAQEMLLGVFGPLVLLAIFEFWPVGAKAKEINYLEQTLAPGQSSGNAFALKILGYAVIFTGILVGLLSFGSEGGWWWILIISLAIIGTGYILVYKSKQYLIVENKPTV
ncbi:MAG: sodium transporter, partial [Saprospiraceae bacterium]|nr:sodium transporter [Saprospiraceae bacterium]